MNDSSSDSEDSYIPVGLSKINLGKFANIKPQTCNVLVKSVSTDSFNLIPELQYEYLLNRAEEFLKKNTKLNKKNIKLIVTRKNKKTQVNIEEVAIQLNRQPEHLSKYILKGLFSEGTINDKGILNIDGRFVQSEVENLIKRFINEFVICKSCESIDNTVIIKKNRLFFVHCNDCNSERCVGNTIEGVNLNKL
ncbi:protein translation initiation factor IF-2b [Enterocytozoon bieneusi H348]|nr:protein translation initiation factor IF-2b [Enterocytozoon bieneusi H348]|eukprot:XP_002650257.1 protein translation initiation factor IF-2b [Enterocytozoon bieneusi H348]